LTFNIESTINDHDDTKSSVVKKKQLI